ncbi:MAG: hypothetical protein QOE15_1028, partial [Acidimicrobiaceae bacterium]|nr:hypothetical protein [Acidimicrobiaceae bacterium]
WIDPDAIADDIADFVLRGLGSSSRTDAGTSSAAPAAAPAPGRVDGAPHLLTSAPPATTNGAAVNRRLGPVAPVLPEADRSRLPSR